MAVVDCVRLFSGEYGHGQRCILGVLESNLNLAPSHCFTSSTFTPSAFTYLRFPTVAGTSLKVLLTIPGALPFSMTNSPVFATSQFRSVSARVSRPHRTPHPINMHTRTKSTAFLVTFTLASHVIIIIFVCLISPSLICEYSRRRSKRAKERLRDPN